MKKILSIILSLSLSIGVFGLMPTDVKAAESVQVDGSYLLDDTTESSVTLEYPAKGVYLKSGTSTLTKKGSGIVGAGGATIAQRRVNRVFIGVRVQRLENGKWASYKYWSAENKNDVGVTTSKLLNVRKGYYYRVFSTHIAGPDSTESFTDGLWID